ncbi:MAG: DNA polymerase III subunit chi [Alphaproteobacteria bacterium]|nr:DNA polymerase III subunit chi [Alphaproteobacteria bacterium]
MTEIRFYHLTATPLERALPQLLEKALQAGFKSVVKVADGSSLTQLNKALWTYSASSFLPHGSAEDGFSAEQPIYLTYTDDNPNNATLLAITDGASAESNAYDRILDLFDGHNPTAVAAARERWKTYKNSGHNLQYWQQNDVGGWAQKA